MMAGGKAGRDRGNVIMVRTRILAAACALFAPLIAAASPGAAQDYPTKQIKIIVPFPAGGASDAMVRIVAEKLGDALGNRRILVDNRAGAAGNIGTDQAAKSEADGYTILFGASGPLAVNKTLFGNLAYDPQKDLEPISLMATLPNVLVVNPKLPVKSTRDLIDYLKAKPGEVNYSSIGNGSSQHLAAALFERETGVKMNHVPYRAAGQIVMDMISGDVPVSFQLLPNVIAQLQDNKIRAVSVMSSKRLAALPDVPTMAEQGVGGLESAAWFGLLVPRGTPAAIKERLSKEVVAVLNRDDVKKLFKEIGAEPTPSTPEEFRKLIAAETEKWHGLIKTMNIKPD